MPTDGNKHGGSRGFGDRLEKTLDSHPKLVSFVLLFLLALAALEPFLTQGLSNSCRTLIGNIRESVMNVVGAASVLLGFYAIHQATSFRREDAEQKAADDLKRAREQKTLELGQSEIKEKLRVLLESREMAEGMKTRYSSVMGDEGQDNDQGETVGGLSGREDTK